MGPFWGTLQMFPKTGNPQMTKTFKTKIDAVRFSRDLENKLFRQQHDIDKKKFPLLKDALLRYQQEIVPLKRSAEMENKLIKHICYLVHFS